MEKQWHVVHVLSRTAKKVAERLENKEIIIYLPIQKQLRPWSDRKKWVDMVVLSGYVFVKIFENESLEVLKTVGVSRFLKHDNKMVCISDLEMQRFKNFIEKAENKTIEFSKEKLPVGTLVTFKGISGEIVKHKGKNRLKIQLSHSGNFSIELSADEIEKM
jgi:transcription antitermination factor NusG